MATNPEGFLKIKRKKIPYRPVYERIKDFKEVFILPDYDHSQQQGQRCMDCGTPFCHWACPLGNIIPEWNEKMSSGRWQEAYYLLSKTNILPEITGRLCPALCEYSCVLGYNDDPVSVRENELAIIEYAWKKGWVKANIPKHRTNKKIAVIGSGPAGLSAAYYLNQAGHKVTVFERDKKFGGIMRYGIPDFKLDKKILDRRIELWKKEGINFLNNIEVGKNYPTDKLVKQFDAICLAGGSRQPRDLNIPGRSLKGIYFAMDYLTQANRMNAKEKIETDLINAKNKKVVVIGGGDTGADCVGTAHRQGAKSVIQIELMPKPPECRSEDYPWPKYPFLLKTSSSHEEGGKRLWSILTKAFLGEKGWVKKILCAQIEFIKQKNNSCPLIKEIPNSEFTIEADLVIIAIGFLHPEHGPLLKSLKVKLDQRGNVATNSNYQTNYPNIFSAGDMRRGQSLIVWALAEGKNAAHYIDSYLTGQKSSIPIF